MQRDPSGVRVPDEASSVGARRPGRGRRTGRCRVRRGAAPGRGDLGLARVHRAGTRLLRHRGGEVRHRRGQGSARDHRSLRLPDVRRHGSGPAPVAGQLPAARDPRAERLLAGRGHGDRPAAQADHRRAGSRVTMTSTRRAARASGRSGANSATRVPVRVLRHLLRGPDGSRAGRRLRRAARRPHHQLRRALQLRVDGRPGTAQRPRLPRAVHAGRAR